MGCKLQHKLLHYILSCMYVNTKHSLFTNMAQSLVNHFTIIYVAENLKLSSFRGLKITDHMHAK